MESIDPAKFKIIEGKKLSLDVNFRHKVKQILDENSNVIEVMEQSPSPVNLTGGMTPLLPQMRDLNLQECSQAPIYHQFGQVETIIQTMGLALVRSSSSTLLLDIDTPVFAAVPMEDLQASNYVILGKVDDILGSVGSPVYSVRLARGISDVRYSLDKSVVYIQTTHPDTNILRVETNRGERYSVISGGNAFYEDNSI